MTDETILENFENNVRTLLGLTLAAQYPNKLSVPHMMARGFMDALALGVASQYEFKQLKEAKEAGANAPAQEVAAGGDEKAEEEAKEESEEEESVSMGGFFD